MRIISKNFLENEIKNVGFDQNWLKIGINKHKFLNIKINDLRAIEANILKQTALSAQCDCAVHKNVINSKIEISDCVLSGTISQLINVAKKLSYQPLSLPKIGQEIIEQINIFNKKPKETKIVGILNITENSFSDGNEFLKFDKTIERIEEIITQGAQIVDIGAESTKPNSIAIDPNIELERLLPAINYIKTNHPQIEISIDTRNATTAKEVLKQGVHYINDVSGLNYDKDMAKTVAEFKNSKIIISHNRATPDVMNDFCNYNSLIDEVYFELKAQVQNALNGGILKDNIIIDPAFGFSKNTEQNIELMMRIEEFKSMGYPIMVGVSRKRFLQAMANVNSPKEADEITGFTSAYFATKNIEYIRVHNVKKTKEAINFAQHLLQKV